jgi:hypothetical protein
MIKDQIYMIPHTCFVCEWSTEDYGGYSIFGAYADDFLKRFDKVSEVKGFRCIRLVERVRNHWVVDTWLDCIDEPTPFKTKLMSDKYLRKLIRNINPL